MNITSFLIYCFIITFTPGPTNIVILSTVHNFGTKKAMEYTYGSTIAFGLLLVISAMLNTVLIAVIPKILPIMQIIGSFYILYLAYQIYKMDVSESAEIQTATFMSGFLMQFINPKVVLFTMTVIPSFVMPYYTAPPALAVFAAAITIIGFCAFVTWVLFGVMFKEFLQKHQKTVNIVMALFLVYSNAIIREKDEALCSELLLSLADSFTQTNLCTSYKKDNALIIKAKDMICCNLKNVLRLDDICKELDMSKFKFIRLFKANTGISPYQYFLNYKVELAKKLIEKNRDVYSAVAECGFVDLTHLNKHFKSIYGITAFEYMSHLN